LLVDEAFDEVYDDATMAAIERWQPSPADTAAESSVPSVGGWRRGVGASAFFLAAAMGMQEALEPERRRPVIEELDLTAAVDDGRPVIVFLVPGAPRLSHVLVRPWLF
jgi:hypothetical protein